MLYRHLILPALLALARPTPPRRLKVDPMSSPAMPRLRVRRLRARPVALVEEQPAKPLPKNVVAAPTGVTA